MKHIFIFRVEGAGAGAGRGRFNIAVCCVLEYNINDKKLKKIFLSF